MKHKENMRKLELDHQLTTLQMTQSHERDLKEKSKQIEMKKLDVEKEKASQDFKLRSNAQRVRALEIYTHNRQKERENATRNSGIRMLRMLATGLTAVFMPPAVPAVAAAVVMATGQLGVSEKELDDTLHSDSDSEDGSCKFLR